MALAAELACLPTFEGATPEQAMEAAVRTGVLDRDQVFKMMSKAYDMIEDANAELMPFFHAKRPQEVHVKKPNSASCSSAKCRPNGQPKARRWT
ncbi:hypothetical protein [Agrobacterium sp. LMR679]|uniref:hypothetical protein n=1 Tax=Agrobacterium sp. LMR679 TaxID=3014335 RepID=UPI0022AEEC22|nr:hypothetical protein [Agrobacterium sp. LMR679]MCZ4076261.1 hypothetical protein [Agrobacterium sp. LMR679]